jgi:hypothetical protein
LPQGSSFYPTLDKSHYIKKYGKWSLSKNSGYSAICHAELVSASNKINGLRDPEINSG